MNILNDIRSQFKMGSIADKLIIINVFIFILSIPFFYQFKTGDFIYPNWIALSSNFSEYIYWIWTLVIYNFFHNGFFHLLGNMIVLNFSSRLFLVFFTQKQLMGAYLFGGLFAGIIFILGTHYILGYDNTIVGASGAIMAILVGVTSYQPLYIVRIPLLGSIKLWYITGVILLLYLLEIGYSNTGGHIAHFAGAFFGFIYIKLLLKGIDLSKYLYSIINALQSLFVKKNTRPFKTVHRNTSQKNTSENKSKIVLKDKKQQQLDDILDKISKSGYDSLTKEEKDFLFRAGN